MQTLSNATQKRQYPLKKILDKSRFHKKITQKFRFSNAPALTLEFWEIFL